MWFLFTIITTLAWGAAELFYKKGAVETEKYAHLKICICVGCVMGIHGVVTLLVQDIGYRWHHLLEYFPVSLCYILSMACSFFGMRFIEESILDPIENTSGAICALLCVIFLKEEISPLAAVAILVILMGILGVGFLENGKNSKRKEKIGKKLAIVAFIMPFFYALIDALGSFMDVFYLEMETTPLTEITEENIEVVANTSYELTFFLVAIVLLIFIKVKGVSFDLPKQRDKLLAACLEATGQLTYVYAMAENGAIAAPIISSVCVVSVILSRIFLKEKLNKKYYFFIGLVIAGILLLAVIEGE